MTGASLFAPLLVLCIVGPFAEAQEFYFPIVVPPYNLNPTTGGAPTVVPQNENTSSCLLYIEGFAVTVFKKTEKNSKNHAVASVGSAVVGRTQWLDKDTDSTIPRNTFIYSKDDEKCLNMENVRPPKIEGKPNPVLLEQQFSFKVMAKVKTPVYAYKDKNAREAGQTLFGIDKDSSIQLTLIFNRTSQFDWSLYEIQAQALTVKKGTTDFLDQDLTLHAANELAHPASVRYMGVSGFGYSSYAYAYGCNCTKAALFDTNDDLYQIGLSFIGLQVQPWQAVWRWTDPRTHEQKLNVSFTRNVNDCVPTFSTGSVMSLTVAVIFVAVLIFAYLMLNSIDTVDRFDDPRQKPLVINAKE